MLAGWDLTSAAFIAIVYFSIRGKDADATRHAATSEDDLRTAAEAILVGANTCEPGGRGFRSARCRF